MCKSDDSWTGNGLRQRQLRICVVGIGNAWASDDGIGPQIVEQLSRLYVDTPPDAWSQNGRGDKLNVAPVVTFKTMPRPDVSLLSSFSGSDVLIVVDAVVGNTPPGTVHRQIWQPGLLDSRGVERASSHGFGVREVLNLAETLGQLSTQVILWGIEVASTEPGQGLSPNVAAALPTIVDQLLNELQQLLNGTNGGKINER
jgi:hydrogenase maturation protease